MQFSTRVSPCMFQVINELYRTISQQAMMVQQFHPHSTITTSPTSMSCGPVSVHSSMQLIERIQDQSSRFACVSTHATIFTIQEGCLFPQSNGILSSNSSDVATSCYCNRE